MSEILVSRYLSTKTHAWAESTMENESKRLYKIADLITGSPEDLLKGLKGYADYTFVSLWNRAIEIWNLVDIQNNPYRKFKQENRRLFKNFYQRKEVEITFNEAKDLIGAIEDEETRLKALDLLYTGLRWSESQVEKDGYVLGKGGKLRKVYRPEGIRPIIYSKSKSTFFRHLKKIGLSAHMLRKLAAGRLVSLGMREQDLCKFFGWESFETARYYLQPMQDEEILKLSEAM